MFTKELVQAISDWQRGGCAAQKQRRGERLKQAASSIPAVFRKTDGECYRQIALDEPNLRNLGTSLQLPEAISAWTEDEAVARDFKGGGPPQRGGYTGVIFRVCPKQENVVINLNRLLRDADFLECIEKWKHSIDGFSVGFGRYGNTQKEVVLELSELPLDSIHAWGGFSSTREQLKGMVESSFGNEISDARFDELFAAAGIQIGQYWMKTPDAIFRLGESLKLHANRAATLFGSPN